MDELLFRPVAELAALVKAGEVKPRELVEASLRRIEALDPTLGAFVDVAAEEALEEARDLDRKDPRPFAGVPVAVKNNVAVRGRRLTMSSALLSDHQAGHDAYLVRRLREAGFVIVGTTKLPEFGILPTTEPRAGGPARNPWDPSRTPGGSSGGSASAVASGMVPIAHANDGGGSTRIPAACCGLVGLKPSRGRISRGPESGDSFLVVDGVLTRTVEETAQALDVLSGYDVGDATWAPRPAEPFFLAARRAPGRLRVAVSTRNVLDAEVDPECVRAVEETAALLSDLGHEVTEADVPLPDARALLPLFSAVFGSNIALGVLWGTMIAGHEPGEDEIEPLTRLMRDRANEITGPQLLAVTAQLQAIARTVVAFFADHDVLLTPALAERPLPIGELDGCGENPQADFARSGRFTPYTALFNVTGQPAMTLPVRFGDDGLPTSVQLVGHPLGEETLLQLAVQLETARAYDLERRPEIAATA